MRCLQAPYHAALWGGFRLPILCLFADELREMEIKDHEVLVSYDVSSLFTNVPACITGFSLRILVAGERCKVIGKYFERGSSCEWKIVPGNRTLAGEFFIVNGVFSSLWCLMKILVSVLLVFVIWERVPQHGGGDNWNGLSYHNKSFIENLHVNQWKVFSFVIA